MYEYHGWLSTFESLDAQMLEKGLEKINDGYPASAKYVNGKLHISFSGGPNRNLGQATNIVTYLCGLKGRLSGCVYTNDPDSERHNKFSVIKVVEDDVIEMQDRNFTIEETRRLFE